jgi:adenylyltransferase/sulfurtransferase
MAGEKRLYVTELENNEIKRYMRQIILPEISVAGQKKVRGARVLIVGIGGLGAPVLMYLVSAGVGSIGILDYDDVELHNLQRQVIYTEDGVKRKKSQSAVRFATKLNSTIKIKEHAGFLSEENVESIFKEYDTIADCSDNIKCRYLISDYCKVLGKDLVCASVLKWEGQILVLPKAGPCYRCLFPTMKENAMNCDEAGVVGSICGIIGSMQATEVLKLILGKNEYMMITFNGYSNEYKKISIRPKGKDCSVCSKKKAMPVNSTDKPAKPPLVSLDSKFKVEWETYLQSKKSYTLVDIRDRIHFDICHIEGSKNISAGEIEKNEEILKNEKGKVLLLCNRGITSSRVVSMLNSKGNSYYSLVGGLKRYKSDIDASFPL